MKQIVGFACVASFLLIIFGYAIFQASPPSHQKPLSAVVVSPAMPSPSVAAVIPPMDTKSHTDTTAEITRPKSSGDDEPSVAEDTVKPSEDKPSVTEYIPSQSNIGYKPCMKEDLNCQFRQYLKSIKNTKEQAFITPPIHHDKSKPDGHNYQEQEHRDYRHHRPRNGESVASFGCPTPPSVCRGNIDALSSP